jgi:acyl carrier protein
MMHDEMMHDEQRLRETEKILAAHPLIRQAAVLVQGDEMAEYVIAYVVGDFDDTAERADPFCCHLAAESEVAIPGVFVRIDRMPQADNGEVDREALKNATRGGHDSAGPRLTGGLAAMIADIWRDILPADSVALEDNFFDLGGQSLAITRMSIRIREEIGVDLPLTVFYDSPTVPGIASAIGEVVHSRNQAEQS